MFKCKDAQIFEHLTLLNMKFITVNYEHTYYVSNFDTMATLTVEIDKDRDLPVLQALLSRLGLKYKIDEEDWGDLSDAEIEGIKAGLEDVKAGRIHSHADVMARIDKKLSRS
jgi:predicted transcriptional regulator